MQRSCLILTLAGALAWPALALAHSSGATIAGNSGKVAGQTCGTCHTAGTAPTVAFAGPAMLAPGATAEYTFTVTATAAATVAGLDVAVSSAAAELAPVSPSVQLTAGEIVHKTATPLSGGKAVFNFSVTAPTTAGPLTLYGAGVAGTGGGDGHGAKATFAIQVAGSPVDGGAPADLGPVGVGGNGGSVPPASTGGGEAPQMSAQGGYGCSVVNVSASAEPLGEALLFAVALTLLLRARRRSR